MNFAAQIDSPAPSAMPMPTSHAMRRSTIDTTPAALAPSAIRIPISARREVTAYDVTP